MLLYGSWGPIHIYLTKTTDCPYVGSMLGQRRWQYANVKPIRGKRVLFAG